MDTCLAFRRHLWKATKHPDVGNQINDFFLSRKDENGNKLITIESNIARMLTTERKRDTNNFDYKRESSCRKSRLKTSSVHCQYLHSLPLSLSLSLPPPPHSLSLRYAPTFFFFSFFFSPTLNGKKNHADDNYSYLMFPFSGFRVARAFKERSKWLARADGTNRTGTLTRSRLRNHKLGGKDRWIRSERLGFQRWKPRHTSWTAWAQIPSWNMNSLEIEWTTEVDERNFTKPSQTDWWFCRLE